MTTIADIVTSTIGIYHSEGRGHMVFTPNSGMATGYVHTDSGSTPIVVIIGPRISRAARPALNRAIRRADVICCVLLPNDIDRSGLSCVPGCAFDAQDFDARSAGGSGVHAHTLEEYAVRDAPGRDWLSIAIAGVVR